MYDLLLKGDEVIDPSQALQQRYNVALRDGRVAAVAVDLLTIKNGKRWRQPPES